MTPRLLIAGLVAIAIAIGFALPGHEPPPMKAQIPLQDVAEG